MRFAISAALVIGVLGACASKPVVEREEPIPPAGSETIRLLHADAHEVARVLNDLDRASSEKARSRRSRGCVLYKFGDEGVMEVPNSAALEFENRRRWEEIQGARELDSDELVRRSAASMAEQLRVHLEDSPARFAAPYMPSPPPTFLAWDSRTLVVLEANREPEYFGHVRDLVRRLDAPSDG